MFCILFFAEHLQDRTPTCTHPIHTEVKEEFVMQRDGIEKSSLSAEQKRVIYEDNLEVNNQLGIMCDTCGVEIGYDCHCHKLEPICDICYGNYRCPQCLEFSITINQES